MYKIIFLLTLTLSTSIFASFDDEMEYLESAYAPETEVIKDEPLPQKVGDNFEDEVSTGQSAGILRETQKMIDFDRSQIIVDELEKEDSGKTEEVNPVSKIFDFSKSKVRLRKR